MKTLHEIYEKWMNLEIVKCDVVFGLIESKFKFLFENEAGSAVTVNCERY